MQNQIETKPLPFFFVGKDITLARRADYASNKHTLLSEALGRPDTKSIWYSKEHFVKLLEEIEYAGGDGIRFYFGMYEPEHEYAGQTCLVMNTTRETIINGNTVHVNVVLENEPDFGDRSELPRDIILENDITGLKSRDFNYGSPCPPRCDGFDDLP